ncbi:histidine phosphatase family protein [Nakamurella sp. YIM 132087]|uniref:Histidine phosphatase family protein n=1 Tax=Nakamurella alba TaxID=2665158 RepID=A0A7K1FI03_9ACTN|nr:histidine phosphatase family protein [Nakamurella alba]MTD13069.1 histidine phosphatase family protein [Nakamurella alba]
MAHPAARLLILACGATADHAAVAFPTETSPLLRAVAPPRPLRADRVLAGPELRCTQTADTLGTWEPAPAGLHDLDAGDWTGRPAVDLLDEGLPEFLTGTTSRAPGGESFGDLIARVRHALDGLPQEPHRSLLVVAPLVVRAALVALLDLPDTAFHRFDVAPLTLARVSGFRTPAGTRWNLQGLAPLG